VFDQQQTHPPDEGVEICVRTLREIKCRFVHTTLYWPSFMRLSNPATLSLSQSVHRYWLSGGIVSRRDIR
jgi:hypothetical protein